MATVVTCLAVGLSSGCAATVDPDANSGNDSTVIHVENPKTGVTVLPLSDPADLTLASSELFFTQTPIIIVAPVDDAPAQATAIAAAQAWNSPVLLTGGAVSDTAIMDEVHRLGATHVVAVTRDIESLPLAATLAAESTAGRGSVAVVPLDPDALEESGRIDVRVMDDLKAVLPALSTPKKVLEVMVLTEGTPTQAAAVATAKAAGAWELPVPGGDPRTSSDVVDAIRHAQPLSVVGLGASFGRAEDLEWRVDVAVSGVELPGGGQLALTNKLIVAAAAAPRASSGWAPHDITQAVDLAQGSEQELREAMPVAPVSVVAVELPVTTVTNTAGTDRNYSDERDPQTVESAITVGQDADVQVMLRFASGATPFDEQLARYEEQLKRPGVGVVLDLSSRRTGEGKPQPEVSMAEIQRALDLLSEWVRAAAVSQMVVVLEGVSPHFGVAEPLDLGAGELALVFARDGARQYATDSQATVPQGTFGGWHSGYTDPARDAQRIAELSPIPQYISGSSPR